MFSGCLCLGQRFFYQTNVLPPDVTFEELLSRLCENDASYELLMRLCETFARVMQDCFLRRRLFGSNNLCQTSPNNESFCRISRSMCSFGDAEKQNISCTGGDRSGLRRDNTCSTLGWPQTIKNCKIATIRDHDGFCVSARASTRENKRDREKEVTRTSTPSKSRRECLIMARKRSVMKLDV